MSQRLADRFADCRAQKRTAFVGFVTAGYPTLDATVPALLELEKNGCDVCAVKCWTKEGFIGSYDWRFLCTPQVPGHRLEAGSWQRSAAVRFR